MKEPHKHALNGIRSNHLAHYTLADNQIRQAAGANFANQNLAGAGLSANLANANFRGANLTGATLGYNWSTGAAPGILAGADFTGANLSQAIFSGHDLSGSHSHGRVRKKRTLLRGYNDWPGWSDAATTLFHDELSVT